MMKRLAAGLALSGTTPVAATEGWSASGALRSCNRSDWSPRARA